MKKLWILLIGMTFSLTTISSQPTPKDTLVYMTPAQLKTTNLIFAEHAMLTQKVPLLETKINNLEEINSNWVKIDSLRCGQMDAYKTEMEIRTNKLQKSLKFSSYVAGGSVLASIVLAILCIFK